MRASGKGILAMFKVGDRVKCVEGAGNISYGLVYRVVRISKYKETPFLHVQSDGLGGESGGWLFSRFVLAKAAKFKGNVK